MMQSLKEILRIIIIIVVGEYSKKKVNVYNLIISVSIKTFLLLEFFPSSDFYILSSFFFLIQCECQSPQSIPFRQNISQRISFYFCNWKHSFESSQLEIGCVLIYEGIPHKR